MSEKYLTKYLNSYESEKVQKNDKSIYLNTRNCVCYPIYQYLVLI